MMPTDAYQLILASIDRIEQILREMGYCEDCGRPHKEGVRDC